jgi:hypothetical protein
MSIHNLILAGLLAAGLGISGCKSAPTDHAAPVAATEKKDAAAIDKLFAEAAAQYNRVERNGVVYYCKRTRTMGTNISSLKCMTESQLRVEIETMTQVRDDMRNKMGKCTAGRAGNGGPCGAW